MKRSLRAGAVVAALVLVVLLGLIMAAKVLITPERVRATVLPLAERKLQRPVELGEIRIGLFSGISLWDLVVREKEGAEPFVTADRLVLRYRLWPLLRLKVVVAEVVLEQPRIRVVRLADGSFNFSDLLAEPERPESEVQRRNGSKPETEVVVPPLDLLVSSVSLRGGELLFIDQTAGAAAPLRQELTGLEVAASDISLHRSFPFTIQSKVNQAPLKISGRFDPVATGGNAAITLSGLDAAAFTPYLQEYLPGRLETLTLTVDLQVQGDPGQIAANGKVQLTDLGLMLEETPIRNGRLTIEPDLVFAPAADRLDIRSLQLDYNGISAAVSGSLEQFAAGAAADLSVRLLPLDLKKFVSAAPGPFSEKLAALDPAGRVAAEVRLIGPLSQVGNLVDSGWLDLEGVQVTVGGMRPAAAGRLVLAGDSLTTRELFLSDGANQARLELKVGNLFDKPVVVSRLTAERFLLDPLLAAAAAAKPDTREAGPAADESAPLDLPISAEGKVLIGETLYKGLAVRDFDLAYRLENNILTISRFNGTLAGGRLTHSARVDLGRTPLAFQGKLDLKEIQVEPFLKAFLPDYQGLVAGVMSFEVDASGNGATSQTIKRSIRAKGSLSLGNGRFANTPLVQDLAAYLGLDEFRELGFDQAGGSFTITDGRLSLNSEIRGGDFRMAPRGSIGLDGELDLNLAPRLSPHLSRKLDRQGQFTRFLKDEQGWSELPLKASGHVTAPRFSLDATGVRRQVEQKAREKIEEVVQRQLLERLGPSEPPDQQGPAAPALEEKNPRQFLDEAVRGLFGR